MTRRLLLQAAIALVLALGIAVVADALVVTDDELIASAVDGISAEDPFARIDAVLASADPNRLPVEVQVDGSFAVYSDGEEVDLAEHLSDALAPVEDSSARLLQRTERLDGDRATVALRFDSDPALELDLRFERRGDGWLLQRIRVR